MGTLHLDLGVHDVDLNGISHEASVTLTGDLADPLVELKQRLSVRAITQDIVPEYPLGDVDFSLSAERGEEGIIHIAEAKIANALAGTSLALAGNVDLGEGRRTLSVNTLLTQDLGLLSTIPDRFKGSGHVAVEATVTSPDLAHYQVRAAVKGTEVAVTLPHAGIEVEAANGEVPVTVALEVSDSGVALQRSEKAEPVLDAPLLHRSAIRCSAAAASSRSGG